MTSLIWPVAISFPLKQVPPALYLTSTRTRPFDALFSLRTDWGVDAHPLGFLTGVAGGGNGMLYFWRPRRALAFRAVGLATNAPDVHPHLDGLRLAVAFFDGVVRVHEMAPPRLTSCLTPGSLLRAPLRVAKGRFERGHARNSRRRVGHIGQRN